MTTQDFDEADIFALDGHDLRALCVIRDRLLRSAAGATTGKILAEIIERALVFGSIDPGWYCPHDVRCDGQLECALAVSHNRKLLRED